MLGIYIFKVRYMISYIVSAPVAQSLLTPDPPWAMLSGTAFPLPLSGGMMLYSNLTLLVLGDSCAPASNPLPVGGGFVMVSQSMTPLVLSSWVCELMVALVRFAPDCTSMLFIV